MRTASRPRSSAFAGIRPGSQGQRKSPPGGGYFTRIFSKVVGDKGVVYALVPARPANAPAPAGSPPPINALAADPAYANVRVVTMDCRRQARSRSMSSGRH